MFKPPQPTGMSLNLAPMVDVMMCLIIFFLLASKLVQFEHHPVDLPWAVAAKEVASQDLGQRVTINVRPAADGRDQTAEYVVADWDGKRFIERLLQPEEINSLLRTRSAKATAVDQELRCVIRADQRVQYQHVETVLRACGLAQVSNVVFSTNKGVEPESREED